MIDDTVRSYLDALGSESATPGGGAVAGLAGAQACALMSMVTNLTRDSSEAEAIGQAAKKAQGVFLTLTDDDISCFDAVMQAYQLPRSDAQNRRDEIQKTLMAAAEVPLKMIEQAMELIPLTARLVEIGNRNVITDTAIAAVMLDATIVSARQNVLINLRSIKNDVFNARSQGRLDQAAASLAAISDIRQRIDSILVRE
jgi:formiminotetrahydrofolate cyclodeaminase